MGVMLDINSQINVYDGECGICGSQMDVDETYADSDGDIRVKATCPDCQAKIEDLESKIEDLENQLTELGEQE